MVLGLSEIYGIWCFQLCLRMSWSHFLFVENIHARTHKPSLFYEGKLLDNGINTVPFLSTFVAAVDLPVRSIHGSHRRLLKNKPLNGPLRKRRRIKCPLSLTKHNNNTALHTRLCLQNVRPFSDMRWDLQRFLGDELNEAKFVKWAWRSTRLHRILSRCLNCFNAYTFKTTDVAKIH